MECELWLSPRRCQTRDSAFVTVMQAARKPWEVGLVTDGKAKTQGARGRDLPRARHLGRGQSPTLASSARPGACQPPAQRHLTCLCLWAFHSSALCRLPFGGRLAMHSPPGVRGPVSPPEVFPESRTLIVPQYEVLGLKLSATSVDSQNRGLNVRRDDPTMSLSTVLTCVPASASR